ncbi:hypothetical protein ANN_08187 [Periplaneta americana]|uniref:Uncharacterized protein n=1 Tax=Periplaneta americana TaxID=6978 RepID=A0ABQ8T248_PERAM|nr:hypothetical protein ANN_08187 [Periplaneta americana]
MAVTTMTNDDDKDVDDNNDDDETTKDNDRNDDEYVGNHSSDSKDISEVRNHNDVSLKLPLFYLEFLALKCASCFQEKLKVRIYKTVILSVVQYGCETWTLTLKEEQRFRMFENKVLRKVFGAERDEVTREWRKLHNAELHALYATVVRLPTSHPDFPPPPASARPSVKIGTELFEHVLLVRRTKQLELDAIV